MKQNFCKLVLFGILSIALVSPALAQFKWKDASGRWVYSDQPPPSGIAVQPMTPAAPKTLVSNKPPVAENKQTADDKELAAKRKDADSAQGAKEKQELAKKNQASCEETRANLKTMQGETRVTMTDASGERRVLTEQEKQTRAATAQKDLTTHCNG
jgi:Domain of unknown function (DUF4124)